MENILFKISFPAEFHAQTAVEAAMTLHPKSAPSWTQIDRVLIETQESGVRIIDKTGPLANPADRDHCIQYMVAIPLLFGRLAASDYEDAVAKDPRVDELRAKMQVTENTTFTRNTRRPTSATSATRCRCSSRMGHPASAYRWTFPWVTSSAAPRACRCWSRNSRPAWLRISAQTDRVHQESIRGLRRALHHAGEQLRREAGQCPARRCAGRNLPGETSRLGITA
jgi:hypothetical protein